MSEANEANREQAALWNEAAGRVWVDMQSVLDGMFAPVETLLVEHVRPEKGERVLDVGCGAGATTLAMVRHLGPQGLCLGLDISATLIELAQRRATESGLDRAVFVQADAQTHAFEPDSFDAVISRFGVMFFDDPVTAFANIRRAMRRDGRLVIVAWRGPAENPFMTTAARAAAPLLPSLPKPDPNAPGQFAFADPDRVRGILNASGWKNIDIAPIDAATSVGEKDVLAYVTRLGPVGLALREVDEQTRVRVESVLRAAFDPFVQDGVARFIAAYWLVKGSAC